MSDPTNKTTPDDWRETAEAQEGYAAWGQTAPYAKCPYPRGTKRLLWQDGWNMAADEAFGGGNE